jgi:hypothetical protein
LNPKNQHQVQSQKVFGAIGDWIIGMIFSNFGNKPGFLEPLVGLIQ